VTALLEANGLVKSFDGLRAVDDVTGLRLTSPRRIDLEMTQGWKAPRFC